MKSMLKTVLFTAVLLVSLNVHAQYAEPVQDIGAKVQIIVPGLGDNDLFDTGLGIEVQYRNWIDDVWGYQLALGYAVWQADSGSSDTGLNFEDFSGDITVIPVGASALFNLYHGDRANVNAEAGIRYLVVDSDVDARDRNAPSMRYDLDIGDSIVARIGIEAEYLLNEDMTFTFGLAFDQDFSPGDVDTDVGSGSDNEMSAFLVELALRMPL